MTTTPSPNDRDHYRVDWGYLDVCLEEAKLGLAEGGIPIGAVLVEDGEILSRGHNRRVQDGDPLAHGEIDCIRRAGRRTSYDGVTLYSSASPCFLCSGAALQMGIKRVVSVGYKYLPETKAFLESFGVEVVDVPHQPCLEILEQFAREHPDIWMEDIGGYSRGLGRWTASRNA
jgi:cytosine/creatinine deaminase